jgi:hypothetical protein
MRVAGSARRFRYRRVRNCPGMLGALGLTRVWVQVAG